MIPMRGHGQADDETGDDQHREGRAHHLGQLRPAEAGGQGDPAQGGADQGEAAAGRLVRVHRPEHRGDRHQQQDDQERLADQGP
jgi:hypothetical protein